MRPFHPRKKLVHRTLVDSTRRRLFGVCCIAHRASRCLYDRHKPRSHSRSVQSSSDNSLKRSVACFLPLSPWRFCLPNFSQFLLRLGEKSRSVRVEKPVCEHPLRVYRWHNELLIAHSSPRSKSSVQREITKVLNGHAAYCVVQLNQLRAYN